MTTVAFYSPALRKLYLKHPNELQERPICVVLADSVRIHFRPNEWAEMYVKS